MMKVPTNKIMRVQLLFMSSLFFLPEALKVNAVELAKHDCILLNLK